MGLLTTYRYRSVWRTAVEEKEEGRIDTEEIAKFLFAHYNFPRRVAFMIFSVRLFPFNGEIPYNAMQKSSVTHRYLLPGKAL